MEATKHCTAKFEVGDYVAVWIGTALYEGKVLEVGKTGLFCHVEDCSDSGSYDHGVPWSRVLVPVEVGDERPDGRKLTLDDDAEAERPDEADEGRPVTIKPGDAVLICYDGSGENGVVVEAGEHGALVRLTEGRDKGRIVGEQYDRIEALTCGPRSVKIGGAA